MTVWILLSCGSTTFLLQSQCIKTISSISAHVSIFCTCIFFYGIYGVDLTQTMDQTYWGRTNNRTQSSWGNGIQVDPVSGMWFAKELAKCQCWWPCAFAISEEIVHCCQWSRETATGRGWDRIEPMAMAHDRSYPFFCKPLYALFFLGHMPPKEVLAGGEWDESRLWRDIKIMCMCNCYWDPPPPVFELYPQFSPLPTLIFPWNTHKCPSATLPTPVTSWWTVAQHAIARLFVAVAH